MSEQRDHVRMTQIVEYFTELLLDSWYRFQQLTYVNLGPDSEADIGTAYVLDGPGIEFRWGRDFPHMSRSALRSTQPPVNGYRLFPRGKVRPEHDADPPPLLLPRSKIE
jgi:hypothetical protein